MKDHTVISLDIAKNKLQTCLVRRDKVLENKLRSRKALKSWLAKQRSCRVVMESCGGASYWGRLAKSYGHEVLMIPPTQVKAYRTGHKTDANDALAIVAASRSVNVKPARLLTVEDQGIQSLDRIRGLLDRQKTQISNQLRGLLLEFGVVMGRGCRAMRRRIPEVLEDGEIELPQVVRDSVYELWLHHGEVDRQLAKHDERLRRMVNGDAVCGVLMQLEGVGPIGAVKLKMQLSQNHYSSGRNAAACIGATPQQYSSGGIVRMGGVRKVVCDQSLRSVMFLGARSVVAGLKHRLAKTDKERWLKALVARRGANCASMALVNKNIRTAYALLKHHDEYRATPLVV